ncbi:hypothetical protein BGZ63DRAFT_387471 [Mariannaea sp. PMI_226]|nr:hypothetical protein BGZ63DRAFT_387471 [Mariannaea sp. PMI_226]
MGTTPTALSFEWTQTSPSTYERALDSFDKFFIFIGSVGQGRPDKQNWHVTSAIRVETTRSNFVDDVKSVWINLRYKFPGYAAVVEDDRWIYRTADDETELNSWLSDSFYIHDTNKTARQLFPFDTNPSRRPVLHVLPRTQELVLQSPHTHLDGLGSATFFNHMLKALVAPPPTSQPAFGTEGINLQGPCSVAARVQPYTPAQKAAWDATLHTFISGFPTVRLENENKGGRAGRTNLLWLSYDSTDTTQIVNRVRELGISVTSAAQAAISLSARLHGRVPNTTHSTMAIYNARPHIDDVDFPHKQLVGSYVFAMPAVFPLVPDSFIETARLARQVYLAPKKDDLLVACSPFWATDIPAVLSAPLPEGMPVPSDLQLSSVGVLDKYLGTMYQHQGAQARPDVAVRDFWISLDMLSPNVAVEMWTFAESLVIQPIYNEAYHLEESISAILGLIHEQLAHGLGLDLKFNLHKPGDENPLVASKKDVDGIPVNSAVPAVPASAANPLEA